MNQELWRYRVYRVMSLVLCGGLAMTGDLHNDVAKRSVPKSSFGVRFKRFAKLYATNNLPLVD